MNEMETMFVRCVVVRGTLVTVVRVLYGAGDGERDAGYSRTRNGMMIETGEEQRGDSVRDANNRNDLTRRRTR
jgi:hypothetical protein